MELVSTRHCGTWQQAEYVLVGDSLGDMLVKQDTENPKHRLNMWIKVCGTAFYCTFYRFFAEVQILPKYCPVKWNWQYSARFQEHKDWFGKCCQVY